MNWLRLYGSNKPRVEIDKSFEKLGSVNISGFSGQLYRGGIDSDSDVGSGKISLYYKLQLAGQAFYINKSNPKLRLKYKNLVPVWSNENALKSYQYINLKGYIAIINISNLVKAVLYANAANYQDINGNQHNNFGLLDQELLQLVKSIEINKL